MADEIKDTIKGLAQKPKTITTDGGTTVEVNVQDAIAADRYLASKEAVASKPKFMGIRVGVLRGPGQF